MSASFEIHDPVVASALTRMGEAAELEHSGRSFLEHLLCTWRILADWRMPPAVCRAGLLHSAYSTSSYPHAVFDFGQRELVRSIVGREAEALAHRFCTMQRRGFWDALARAKRAHTFSYPDRLRAGAPVRVARSTLDRLLIIESANIAEQSKAADGGPAPWMSRVFRWWDFLDERSIPLRARGRPRLAKRADEAAIAAYRRALKAPARRARPLLDRAIALNPWAAEPRILRALCALEMKEHCAGPLARDGADLLAAWAVAWDKRLSTRGWKVLADRIDRAARVRGSPQPRFECVCAILEQRMVKPDRLRL
jgi:hypothetical protein